MKLIEDIIEIIITKILLFFLHEKGYTIINVSMRTFINNRII